MEKWRRMGNFRSNTGAEDRKTYFLNSKEIVQVAENWASIVEKLTISKTEKETPKKRKKIVNK